MFTLITNGTIVNEGQAFVGNIFIKDDRIIGIPPSTSSNSIPSPANSVPSPANSVPFPAIPSQGLPPIAPASLRTIDATGCYVLPGIIDTHVHFREPGLTDKADIESESRAAAYGGVTSYFDMPNCKPQTTTLEALREKQQLAAEKSHVNYAFFFGATTDNTHLFKDIDKTTTPGVKLFMGSSTGNMLVDGEEALAKVFATAKEEGLIVMAHCEDNDIISEQTKEVRKIYGDDADVSLHPQIRNREACKKSTLKAMVLAKEYDTRLHVAHISTKEEAELFTASAKELGLPVTFEACLPHIIFNDGDYATKGARIKCNPAVKTEEDRLAIVEAIKSGAITTIATDHAPHTWEEKQGGCLKATSGMPMLQFSLISMLEAAESKGISIEQIVQLMCHNPARLFGIKQRGFIREGYKADIAIVRRTDQPWTLTKEYIKSKCGWSPLEGEEFHWQVIHTLCNGNHVLDNGVFDESSRGEQIILQSSSCL